MAERLLVNFFYAHPVGHVVEALHYCLGHHAADPTRDVAVVLNAASAVELASFCAITTARATGSSGPRRAARSSAPTRRGIGATSSSVSNCLSPRAPQRRDGWTMAAARRVERGSR